MAWLGRLTETHRRIRLARGVVGKTGHCMLAVITVWAVIFWRLGVDVFMDGALLTGGVIVTGGFGLWVRSTQRFAERNPDLALLEGAEFLEYQRIQAAAKGLPAPATTSLSTDPDQGLIAPIEPGEIEEAEEP